MTAYRNPGRRRGRARRTEKGRQPIPAVVREIRAAVGCEPYRRDLLLEYLHTIHDHYHHLAASHIAALADITNWHMAEIFEVASFYAHFEIVKEDETPPPNPGLRVCTGLPCRMAGSDAVLDAAGAIDGVQPRTAPCMGRCAQAPVAEVGHNHIGNATPDSVRAAVEDGRHAVTEIAAPRFADYRDAGGLTALLGIREGVATGPQAIAAIEASGLKGLGGAGFPAGHKWRLVADQPAPRYLVVNADEGEPGTFKDRHIFERHPYRFLEGMYAAAFAVGAGEIYIYLRDEYRDLRRLIEKADAALRNEIRALPALHIRRGAGAYVCGEESAMLESLEGRRGLPRHRPPYAAQVGLFGRPTLIHNVETLFFAGEILARGPEWYAGQGRNGRSGMRHYSVSGRIADPGVKLAPAGITANELIAEYCGGMAAGHVFAAFLPGGASGGILPARLGDIPLDYGTLEDFGCFLGSAGIIVLSESDDVRDAALNAMEFFADESCGQCTPCRVGTEKAARLMAAGNWDAALLDDLRTVMAVASICGLGQAAPNPVRSVFRYFGEGGE